MDGKFMIVKKGYDMQEVDAYVTSLEQVIKNYKEKDDTIKNAIINAQIAADGIVAKATGDAKKTHEELLHKAEELKASIFAQKRFVKEFQDSYNELVKRHLHEIDDNEISRLYKQIDDFCEYTENLNNNESSENMSDSHE